MTQEKMTIHRALAELKTMDSRIANAINSVTYTMAVKHSAEKISGVPVAEVKENIKSGYQKVQDLIARRNAMKRAVVLSNATTKVNVGGLEMTVAEAIEYKNHGVEYKHALKRKLINDHRMAQSTFDANSGEVLEKKAEQYVLSVIAAQPKDSKMSVDSDAMKTMRAEYLKNNAYDMIDPIGVMKTIEALDNEITEFETEIDACLSVSNATTVIEFEY